MNPDESSDPTIRVTSGQILALFPSTLHRVELSKLPDRDFTTGGRVTDACRLAGYDKSGRTVVNQQHAWSLTVDEWAHTMGL